MSRRRHSFGRAPDHLLPARGKANADAGTAACQSNRPVRPSNARKRRSVVAPMNVQPLRVSSAPLSAAFRSRTGADWESPTAPDRLLASLADWRTVLGFRNIQLLMAAMLCWLTCLVTTSAFMPSYLIDHLHLSFGQMGSIMSAIGFGAAAGTLLLPWLRSDRSTPRHADLDDRRRHLAARAVVLGRGGGAAVRCAVLGPFFNNALITLTVGPVCSETVPPGLMATASGVVIAVGEMFGGGSAPILAGQAAERFGIDHRLALPIAMMPGTQGS